MASVIIDGIDTSFVGGDILCEFLEVAIHCILHNRGLYPAGVFEKYKKYNVPVQMCTHPEVKLYIADIIDGLRLLNDKGEVEKVAIVILSQLQKPLERFVFEIAKPKPLVRNDTFLYQLEQSLRAFILKLNVSEVLLKSLPEDCTWTVQVHTKESAAQRIEEHQVDKNFPWMEVDERETNLEDSKVFPLKAVDSEYIKMQLLVEESGTKISLEANVTAMGIQHVKFGGFYNKSDTLVDILHHKTHLFPVVSGNIFHRTEEFFGDLGCTRTFWLKIITDLKSYN